jgi:hypothetical protein
VADGLTADGLVQRRRTVPRPSDVPGPAPDDAPRPVIPAQRTASARPAGEPEPQPLTTSDGLPRRVRQASLAPQLRSGPAEDQRDTQPLRSPEQVRNLMSALQRGTTRGRLAAAGIDPGTKSADAAFAEAATVSLPVVRDRTEPTGNGARDRHPSTDPGTTTTAAGDRGAQSHDNDVTRPDKDA